jgi:hypothetical protein
MLSWQVSGELIVLIILGGVARPFGPVAGAIAFVLIEYLLGGLTERWQFSWDSSCSGPSCLRAAGSSARSRESRAMTEAVLAVRNLSKTFGALKATDDVSLDLRAGRSMR